MILLLDVGNSRIKWAGWQAGQWYGQDAVPVADATALAPVLAQTEPNWVGVSCVAGDKVRSGLAAVLAAAGIEPYWLAAATRGHGLLNGYDRPGTLGSDRYSALIAAVRARYAPCVVVSAGTAVTVDALSGDGEFLGGMILPSATLMKRSLVAGAAALANVEGDWTPFPRATGDAVTTGVWTAIASAVEAMRARLIGRLGRDVMTVITGGDGVVLAARLAAEGHGGQVRIEERLVLEGLLWVARDLGVPGA